MELPKTIEHSGFTWTLEDPHKMQMTQHLGEAKFEVEGQDDVVFTIVGTLDGAGLIIRTNVPHPDNSSMNASYSASLRDSLNGVCADLFKMIQADGS